MCGVIIFYSSFRPTAEEVLCHCHFWSEEKQLVFFEEVSAYIYKEKTSNAVKALNENASIVFESNWKEHITADLKSGQYLMSIFKYVDDV